MKNIIVSILVIISFASCKKGGTYYCKTYVSNGNTTTYNDDAVKKWFPSFKEMQNYEQKYKRQCFEK
jgi:phage pi2 protein 07